jgi:hypothetical protein
LWQFWRRQSIWRRLIQKGNIPSRDVIPKNLSIANGYSVYGSSGGTSPLYLFMSSLLLIVFLCVLCSIAVKEVFCSEWAKKSDEIFQKQVIESPY